MANHHFANVGDVLKHLVLAEVLAGERPRTYFETHAGSLDYSLLDRDPGPGGVWDFLEAARGDETLGTSRYAKVLATSVGTEADPGRYPGSMGVALQILGPRTRLIACDLDPASCRSLDAGLRAAGASDATVLEGDGLAALTASNPMDRLVLIDPFKIDERSPGAGVTSWQAFTDIVASGAAGLLWYAIRYLDQRLVWPAKMIERGGTAVWRGELRWSDSTVGMGGCGLLATGLSSTTMERVAALFGALASALADRPSGLRAASGNFRRRGVGTPWHPHGAAHATADEVEALLAPLGPSIAILDKDGSTELSPIPKDDIAVDTDETGLVRLVIDDDPYGGRPYTLRVGLARAPWLETDDGDRYQLTNAGAPPVSVDRTGPDA